MEAKRPANLAKAGRELWNAVIGKYEFRPDELRILEDACREADLIDDMEKAQRGADRIVKGSMGQPVINPLISELRQHRATLATLLRGLKLPDEGAGTGADGSQQRQAAQARWAKRA
ncbi:hypothetical protein [Mycobacterium malmoense]|uniref:hypothetical protein n=1 Tax=Mycobacterium malmoense TaxID=1780 RepID=UPI0008F95636|nr:hypothetical protein [Mycobacterium malmoense]OIN80879.1 hypothetical protein BMG05_11135 [Mycobacterium malmoense]